MRDLFKSTEKSLKKHTEALEEFGKSLCTFMNDPHGLKANSDLIGSRHTYTDSYLKLNSDHYQYAEHIAEHYDEDPVDHQLELIVYLTQKRARWFNKALNTPANRDFLQKSGRTVIKSLLPGRNRYEDSLGSIDFSQSAIETRWEDYYFDITSEYEVEDNIAFIMDATKLMLQGQLSEELVTLASFADLRHGLNSADQLPAH